MTTEEHEVLKRIVSEEFDGFDECVRRCSDVASLPLLEKALVDLKARRAHLAVELSNLNAAKRYLPKPEPRASILG